MKSFKRNIFPIILMFILTMGSALFFLHLSNIDNYENSGYTEEYIDYLKLSDQEKSKVNIVPDMYPVTLTSEDKAYANNLETYSETTEIPEYYNLRDEITLYTDNQSQLGLCWAYASVKSLETFLALNYGEYWNFSEGYVSYAAANLYSSYQIGNGGTWYMFYYAMQNYGMLSESYLNYDDVYSINRDNMQYYDFLRSDADYTYDNLLQQVNISVDRFDFDIIKAHIMQNGSLYTTVNSNAFRISVNGDYYVSNTKTYGSDHAVSIIGWDDNFSKENFPTIIRPNSDGAFIALNSWGSGWSDEGIYYISYEDVQVNSKTLLGFSKKTSFANDVLILDEVTNTTSTYDKNADMNTVFNLGDEVTLDYTLQNTLNTAPEVQITINKNNVDITDDFIITKSQNNDITTVEINDDVALSAGTYIIEFEYNGEIYKRSFVIVSGAEINCIITNTGPAKMYNSISAQSKTFSANYVISNAGKYISVGVFVNSLYYDITEINIDNEFIFSNVYFEQFSKISLDNFIVTKQTYDLNIITSSGYTETYKIFIISNNNSDCYAINYNLNGGTNSQLNPRKYDTVSDLYTLQEPTKKGYTFEGWHLNTLEGEKITTLPQTAIGNILLVANWVENVNENELQTQFMDYSENIVTSNNLIYGYTGTFTADFSSLEESNLTLKWYINSVYYSDYDLLSQISILLNAGDYTISCEAIKNNTILSTQQANFSVTKKALSLTWSNNSFVYNTLTQKPIATVSGLLGEDTYSLNYEYKKNDTVVTNTVSAGSYTATITNLSDDNYIINQDYQITFIIAKKELSLIWNNISFVYNTQIQKPSVTISGLLNTDSYPLNIQFKRNGTVIDNPVIAGTYTATITNQSNDNYVINDNYETTFVIAKKELNFTWNNTSFVYNSQIQKPDAIISGLLGTDTFSLDIEYIINDATVENPISAGTYKAVLTNPLDEKYIINGNQEINFTINKADINITMSNLTAKFSDDLLDITNAYSLTGTIYNDELIVSAFTNAIPHISGTYILSVNTNSNSNYNVTINSGTYTIQNGSVITYQLPNGETETYYLDNGDTTPDINSIYTPDLFSVLSVELIDDENNHVIYKITEISFLPVIIVCSGLLLVVMLFLISILSKRRRWRS